MGICAASQWHSINITLCVLVLTSLCYSSNITNSNSKTSACSCGYYDKTTGVLFTESVIVYFNETTDLPNDEFVIESYEHKYEKGWNSVFRSGASIPNVQIGNESASPSLPSSLELYIDPSTKTHLVVGADVRTSRRDIHYGSFTSLLRSPRSWAPGSAISMLLTYNETETTELNVMNTNDPTNAWVSMLVHQEFPDRQLGVNFTDLANLTTSPWEFTEFRIDWMKNETRFYIDGRSFRNMSRIKDTKLPSTPAELHIKHWSIGNFFSTQGPPAFRSAANVGWVRLFFNSSSTTEEEISDYDARCQGSNACSVSDMSLRGSSPYSPLSTLKWKQKPPERRRIIPAILTVVVSISVSIFLLLNAILRRLPYKRMGMTKGILKRIKKPKQHSSPYAPSIRLIEADDSTSEKQSIYDSSWMADSRPPSTVSFDNALAARSNHGWNDEILSSHTWRRSFHAVDRLSKQSSEDIVIHMSTVQSDASSIYSASANAHQDTNDGAKEVMNLQEHLSPSSHFQHHNGIQSSTPSTISDVLRQGPTTLSSVTAVSSANGSRFGLTSGTTPDQSPLNPVRITDVMEELRYTDETISRSGIITPDAIALKSENQERSPFEYIAIENNPNAGLEQSGPTASPNVPVAKQRVDHLAGLVALSSLLVTAIHFALTFTPATINPGAFKHYSSEIWARKIVDPYLLNLIWIGPFLMTSTRFLVSSYLRSGQLLGVAEKTVGRVFRLIIPVTAIAMLEYFFMDSGATAWLEYLPSVTWSTWPFTVVPTTFGHFLNEILEIVYIIPNAAPQITFNYCTGVLWTIPVQLQGSWVTLIGAIVIREIKTPWKRFSYYAFCILTHWYFLSWGSHFYFGIMLTDLDLTYQWRKWLHPRPRIYYPLICLSAVLGFGGLTLDVVTQWTDVNYTTYEYGVHPDIPTGLLIMQTGADSYPQYYVPKLNGLVFSVGFQVLVELSPFVQKLLSNKFFVLVFPHIFTIYLIHGFIFWSLGAMICVRMAAFGLPYWLNLLIVAICCYSVLVASLPLLTPVVENLGKNVTSIIWQYAHERPAPRRPTLYPFPHDLFSCRGTTAVDEN